jgi:hypothetical protein
MPQTLQVVRVGPVNSTQVEPVVQVRQPLHRAVVVELPRDTALVAMAAMQRGQELPLPRRRMAQVPVGMVV